PLHFLLLIGLAMKREMERSQLLRDFSNPIVTWSPIPPEIRKLHLIQNPQPLHKAQILFWIPFLQVLVKTPDVQREIRNYIALTLDQTALDKRGCEHRLAGT